MEGALVLDSRDNLYLPEPFCGLSDEELIEGWSYEFRFRDPVFVELWQRFQDACRVWEAAWWKSDIGTPMHFDDIECPDIPEAKEFIEARRMYLEDVRIRIEIESREVNDSLEA